MEIRPLRESELDQAAEVASDAFHGDREENREVFRRFVDPSRVIAAFEGGRILGLCRVIGLAQFFGGRSIPMGGLSSVAVVPDRRGSGLSRQLMQACFESMGSRGEPISTLYPATTGLYRSMGYEVAGSLTIRTTPADPLRALPAPTATAGRPRPMTDADEASVRACYSRFAGPTNGCLDRTSGWWEQKFYSWKDTSRFVVEGSGGDIEGYLVYVQLDGEHSMLGGDFQIAVRELVGTSRDAILALGRLLGSWGTQVERIVYRAAAEDPLLLLLPEQRFETLAEVRWMLRVLDPIGAVAARGFASGVALETRLVLRDETLPANSGGYRLRIEGGRGKLVRAAAAEPAPELSVQGFSSLFSGWATTSALRRAGLLVGGGAEQLESLDTAFAGPTPWMLDEF